MKILKADISENEIQIYNIYLERARQERELFWNRFNIFWAINLALMTAIGYMIYSSYTSNFYNNHIDLLKISLNFLSILGFISSIMWLFIILNGRKWNIFMNNILKDIENTIFENKEYALYNRIMEEYTEHKKGLKIFDIDILDITPCFSIIFILIWLLIYYAIQSL